MPRGRLMQKVDEALWILAKGKAPRPVVTGDSVSRIAQQWSARLISYRRFRGAASLCLLLHLPPFKIQLYFPIMHSTKYILWQEQGRWCGYLKDHPEHVEQGKSFGELQSKLRRLLRDLSSQGQDSTTQEREQYADRPAETPYPMPHRTKTNVRLEKLFSSMLANI